MSENQKNEPLNSVPQEDDISLLDIAITLAKHKIMIIGLTFVAAFSAVGYSLLLPNIYTATAKILPPQSSQSSSVNSIMLAQLGGLAGAAGSALGLKDPNALYIAMMKSRNIGEKIVQRFGLQKVYEKRTMTETLRVLEVTTMIASGKDGVISVGVDDEDPVRAASIANAYIEELNKLMQTFALTEAGQRRQFFETQVKSVKDKLTDAETIVDRTPNTSLHYMEALRNLKFQEAIYEVLSKQFAVAKLDEAKDSPLIQVLDKALPPERKSKPKRALIVMLAALVALFIGVIWALFKESMERAKQKPEQAERLRALKQVLKFW
ncbi:MAG: Wzz/FepE/Etk N-terminal domain-containing protein [Pseudomonadota bacterium]